MKKIAIIGCGFLGGIVADALKRGLLPAYTLSGAMSHRRESAEKLCEGTDAATVDSLPALLQLQPDIVVETASVEMAREACIPVLEAGADFIPLSIGAFSDTAFYEKAQETAQAHGVHIYIPHGAVGGFDVLQTISLMAASGQQEIHAGIETCKGPHSLQNTPVYTEEMEGTEEVEAFCGSCREAIALLPTKVNVAVAQSLATIGPDRATARITSVPGFVGDNHTITVETDGLKARVEVYSSTAAIAGWSIVSLLRNLSSPVCFF